MSRGLGWLQRSILELLDTEDRRFNTWEITHSVYKIEWAGYGKADPLCTDAQHAAVRRALSKLAKQELILHWGNNSMFWSNSRTFPQTDISHRVAMRLARVLDCNGKLLGFRLP